MYIQSRFWYFDNFVNNNLLTIKEIVHHKFSRQKFLSFAKNPPSNNVLATFAFLLQSVWLEEGHVLVNPSHMLVHVRAVLRLILAVDASEVASLAIIAAESLISRYRVLRRETVARNSRTGAMGKAGPAITVGHGSTWKNCYMIRRIKQAFTYELTALSYINVPTFQ